jgi:hypothetical protein
MPQTAATADTLILNVTLILSTDDVDWKLMPQQICVQARIATSNLLHTDTGNAAHNICSKQHTSWQLNAKPTLQSCDKIAQSTIALLQSYRDAPANTQARIPHCNIHTAQPCTASFLAKPASYADLPQVHHHVILTH